MIYIHYCNHCDFIHLLSGHRTNCPNCQEELTELKISYQDYFQMNQRQREHLLGQCQNPVTRKELAFQYKKHKFSKWYKEGGARG